jgi:hypothetical protein
VDVTGTDVQLPCDDPISSWVTIDDEIDKLFCLASQADAATKLDVFWLTRRSLSVRLEAFGWSLIGDVVSFLTTASEAGSCCLTGVVLSCVRLVSVIHGMTEPLLDDVVTSNCMGVP